MKICSIEGCNEKLFCKGFCRKCYDKQYNKQWCIDNPEYDKQYYQDNKEQIAKWMKQYQEDNKEYLAKQDKLYYQDNKEKIAKWYKQYDQDHKEEIAKYNKSWRESNPEYMIWYMKQYYKTPKGKASIKAIAHNRRTLLKDLTVKTIQRVYEANIKKYGVLTCYLCEKPIIEGDNRLRDSLDHSTPITRKGTNKFENLGIAHFSCNSKKGTKTLIEWKALKINP